MASSSSQNKGRSSNTSGNSLIVSQPAANVNPDNVQDSGENARTDADIDGRVKHSLGITAACRLKMYIFIIGCIK